MLQKVSTCNFRTPKSISGYPKKDILNVVVHDATYRIVLLNQIIFVLYLLNTHF